MSDTMPVSKWEITEPGGAQWSLEVDRDCFDPDRQDPQVVVLTIRDVEEDCLLIEEMTSSLAREIATALLWWADDVDRVNAQLRAERREQWAQ